MRNSDDLLSANHVIFFDGFCVLCNGLVDFVIQRDRSRRYRYATLQSEFGQRMQRRLSLPTHSFETFILVEGGNSYIKSTAALRVLRNMPGLWPLLYGFVLVPRPLRDAVYSWVGKNRYRWFGRRSNCRLPSGEERSLFLD